MPCHLGAQLSIWPCLGKHPLPGQRQPRDFPYAMRSERSLPASLRPNGDASKPSSNLKSISEL